MSFLFLCNHVGDRATALAATSTSTASGFDAYDVISGPRSTRWRSNPDTGSTSFLTYALSSNFTADYCVIARADWLLTADGKKLNLVDRDSGGTGYNISPNYNPVTASDLVGIRSQDLVTSFTATHLRGYGIRTQNNGGNEASQISKLYFSSSLSIGSPERGAQWEAIRYEDRMFTPQKGDLPYETEARISLTFRHLTVSQIESFRELPQLLNWPLFIYDSDAYVWPHKLEHVVIEDWTEVRRGVAVWELTVNARRLKHYD